MTAEYVSLNFKTAKTVMRAKIAAKQPVLLVGSPGIGKTALMGQVAAEVGMDLWTVIASACDPTDFGGFPVVRPDGAFDRVPMRAIKEASKKGVILFFDEISQVPKSVEGPMLRGIYEGWFGDIKIHEDTVIVAAMNPSEQTGLGDLSCPMIGRFGVFNFTPEIEEVMDYFNNLGEDGSVLQRWAIDFAATCERAPDLIQMHPGETQINEADQWAAPRNWERALRTLAELPEGDLKMARIVLSGSVGKAAALSFLSILELREHLPTRDEILNDPKGSKLPDASNTKHQIAAMGLLATVATVDCWAAWIYAHRLPSDEIKVAVTRALSKRKPTGKSKYMKEGMQAMTRLNGLIAKAFTL